VAQRAFSDIRAAWSTHRDQRPPSSQAFPPLDVDQVAAKLSLEARAREAGGEDRPASDAVNPDSTERDCLTEIERRAQHSLEEYRAQLAVYDGRIRRALVSADQRVQIEAAGQGALGDFEALAVDDLEQLHLITREVEGRQQEYEEFRKANRLTRLPRVVGGREKVLRFLLIAILFLLESVLNGIMFAKGSDAGLIGGVAQALMLSLLNLGSAILLARGALPQLAHRNFFRKLLGIVAVPVYAVLAVSINLLIAHFRDAFIAHAGEVDMVALKAQLLAHPLALGDANSWVLCAVGIVFSLITLIDAAGLDDPYPGYGRIGRELAQAIARFAQAKSHCLDGLMGRRDAAIKDMADVITDLRSLEYDADLAVQGRMRLHRDFVAHLASLASAQVSLVLRYREANERARKTPPPAYFRNEPRVPAFLEAPALPDPPAFDTCERQLAIARMEHYIGAINAEYKRRVGDYDTLDVLTAPPGRRQQPRHAAA
jgi:hypothetical protein